MNRRVSIRLDTEPCKSAKMRRTDHECTLGDAALAGATKMQERNFVFCCNMNVSLKPTI